MVYIYAIFVFCFWCITINLLYLDHITMVVILLLLLLCTKFSKLLYGDETHYLLPFLC